MYTVRYYLYSQQIELIMSEFSYLSLNHCWLSDIISERDVRTWYYL